MSDLILYDNELDENCYRVRLLLSLLGVPFRKVAIKGDGRGLNAIPDLAEMNSSAELPVLTSPDAVLIGAPAILTFLACGDDNSRRWFPADPATQGQIVGWIARLARELHPALQARRDALFGDGARKGDIKGARLALRGLNDHMTHQQMMGFDWIVGGLPTLADIIAFPAFALSRDYGLDHEEFPALRQWYRRLRTSPGFIGMPGIPDYH